MQRDINISVLFLINYLIVLWLNKLYEKNMNTYMNELKVRKKKTKKWFRIKN